MSLYGGISFYLMTESWIESGRLGTRSSALDPGIKAKAQAAMHRLNRSFICKTCYRKLTGWSRRGGMLNDRKARFRLVC
jgi:hypothetical protein